MCFVVIRTGALGITGLVLVAGVSSARFAVIGLLWNPRLLPFLYLVRYMLMMVGAVAVMNVVWNVVKERHAVDPVDIGLRRDSEQFGTCVQRAGIHVSGAPGGGITTHNGAQVYGQGHLRRHNKAQRRRWVVEL